MARSKAIKKQVKHLLGIQNLSVLEAKEILKESQNFIKLNRSGSKKLDVLRGKTQINLFFEPSTRTQSSFDLAGKRLGADVMSMNIVNSAIKKGETLMDTAMTLNAMHPDLIVVRHQDSGAPNLLSQKVNCAVINAGDGTREHPTQALLDALTIINSKGKIEGLRIAICGDIKHSRVARSNIYLMNMLGAEVNVIAPKTLMPDSINQLGVKSFTSMKKGLESCDIVKICSKNNIKGIIVGNPINMDGSEGPSAQSAKDFAQFISKNISIPIAMWDERLSSEGAFNLSSNLDINVSKKVRKLDENAAQFILQGALDYLTKK